MAERDDDIRKINERARGFPAETYRWLGSTNSKDESMQEAKPDIETDRYIGSGFRDDLETLLNRHSMENGSDTPDFILAEYLTNCLQAFDTALHSRTHWYRPAEQKDGPNPEPLEAQDNG